MRRDNYGVKISQMLEADSVENNTLFTIVQDATNWKIPFNTLLPLLGATGTLEQQGEDGTPVLNPQGSVNYIRNLINGSGIVCDLTPEFGIEISHNFTVDTTGSPLMLNTTAASPTIVSLVAGSGITITSVGNTVVISLT